MHQDPLPAHVSEQYLSVANYEHLHGQTDQYDPQMQRQYESYQQQYQLHMQRQLQAQQFSFLKSMTELERIQFQGLNAEEQSKEFNQWKHWQIVLPHNTAQEESPRLHYNPMAVHNMDLPGKMPIAGEGRRRGVPHELTSLTNEIPTAGTQQVGPLPTIHPATKVPPIPNATLPSSATQKKRTWVKGVHGERPRELPMLNGWI
jgi:hypothetical protein